jgi:hypothetical protein
VRATVERHLNTAGRGRAASSSNGSSSSGGAPMPPVQIRVCAGPKSITVRISDQGGGIPEPYLSKVWAYGFTTSELGMTSEGESGSPAGDGGGGGPGGNGESSPGAEAAEPTGSSSGGGGGGLGFHLAHASEAPRQRYKLAGLGFGLPMSRLYARYFGGELSLQNIPGFGVDTYLTLNNLADMSEDWKEREH